MENKISFQDLLQKIREIPKDSDMAYIGEFPVIVTLNIWLGTDAEGKISHFSPHLNFYQSENNDNEPDYVYAHLDTHQFDASTPQEAAALLEQFARQAVIDTTSPSMEQDEAYYG